ncbi:MAG: hypothetical protein QM757_25750 [Paludibaculum sp.]
MGAQVAASLVLLVAFGSFLDAFRQMMVADPGIRTDHMMMVEFDPSLLRYSPEQSTVFYRRLADEVRRLPGVRSAALSRGVPFRPNFTDEEIIPEGAPLPDGKPTISVAANIVGEDYFETIGTPILQGRACYPARHRRVRPYRSGQPGVRTPLLPESEPARQTLPPGPQGRLPPDRRRRQDRQIPVPD